MHPMHEQTNCCISADMVKSQRITLHLTVDVLTPPYHVCCLAFCALLSINNSPQWVYPKVSPKRPQAQGPCQLPSPWHRLPSSGASSRAGKPGLPLIITSTALSKPSVSQCDYVVYSITT